jgi:hypothetical protein
VTVLLGRLIREPLVHFFGLALLIFAAYGLLNQHAFSSKPRIEVDSARIEQITGLFQRTWKRPPTPDELKNLVADYVNGEIYYREAKRMGLDSDDAVVRQRMRLKMDMMVDVAVDQLQPTDKELADYLAAHADAFRTEPSLAFEQVFLRPDLHPGTLDTDAARLLDQLQKGQVTDVSAAGDATQLPEATPMTLASRIARDFGDDFAAALASLPVGTWSGPVTSGYGLHLVKVTDRKDGAVPPLAEVRDAVAREWKNDRRKELEARRLADYVKRYDIVIDSPAAPSP